MVLGSWRGIVIVMVLGGRFYRAGDGAIVADYVVMVLVVSVVCEYSHTDEMMYIINNCIDLMFHTNVFVCVSCIFSITTIAFKNATNNSILYEP